mgnify:CR=1 FL=1
MDTLDWQGFEAREFAVNGITLHARVSTGWDNARPVLLLQHGFPQTHVMWRRVAQALQPHFRLLMPDLRGYGDSTKLVGQDDHAQASKRAMAGEYSRELSAKVFAGQCRLIELGFRQGGPAGYGLRISMHRQDGRRCRP